MELLIFFLRTLKINKKINMMIWALFWSKVFISRTAMTTYHEQGYVKNQILLILISSYFRICRRSINLDALQVWNYIYPPQYSWKCGDRHACKNTRHITLIVRQIKETVRVCTLMRPIWVKFKLALDWALWYIC
jgi:hypothetical protein